MDTASSEVITLDGACHCGAVKFTATLPYGLASARRCNCSLCRMRGAVVVTALVDSGLTVTEGEEHLATYQFNTKVAEHHFCTKCGIYTHHKRRGNPDEYGVNTACLDGLSPFDFAQVVVNEGRIHPNDATAEDYDPIAGWIRYQPNA